jgi:nucleoside-diphosphate-sugar epimerase
MAGRAVNIARGEELSVNEIARLVLDACAAGDLRPEPGPERPADVRRHYADITRARRELGFDPQVGIADGIRRYVAWFRETFRDPSALLPQEQAINWQPAVVK